ncbi:beta-N-acetylglucosaminidase domain-containing protein [Streptomyces tropicalis]|uniref:Beta-N-acetylglucosaminidase domain-containing protein n=1 Tax=Streptomyces tropicalis TaxID=3034234 RepID=A0ABT6A160_9ACTN|nr:beta-N-acetylglucosaminidase domain-containing protein [Streptomyces tropicalis]MDF3297560.1 beta-N-acetylglucosaminidase domain-containing protein [Streptomyces tropicalis]
MQLRRGKGAAALAFAVFAGTLGAGPAAVAAPAYPGTGPAHPDTPTSSDSAPVSSAGVAVWPRPQSLRTTGGPVRVPGRVALVADPGTDPYALEALRDLLRRAGARTVTDLVATDPVPADALVVRAGAELPHGDPHHALPAGGYLLTVGRGSGHGAVALTGAGRDGLFHAVQTLRQLVRPDGSLPGVTVRDWPGTAVRGTTEGFYGTPWTQAQRLGQLDFMGRTKQNRYLYAPGDDLYRQERWREPYPAGQRAAFRELAERARRNHVTLAWAVAPGQSLCFASDADTRALTRKLDAMWALGFRAFQLQFQNVSYSEWHCTADPARFGSGPEAAARAQAQVANTVARYLAERHPEAAQLSLMPTEYYEDGATPYRTTLAGALDESVQVAWTGVGVVPRTITGGELAEARDAFGHPLVTMDNYPVNDYAEDRIFLGPYTGREPAVASGSAGLLANAMEQAEASRIPLFTAADYAWNPRDYRPEESWRAAVADLAAGDGRRAEALSALAGNDASSVLGGTESAYLRPLIADLWRAREGTGAAADRTAERRLRSAFEVLRELPSRLAGDRGLAAEVAPWSAQAARYGEAGTTALDMLRAQRSGDAAAAWTAYRALERLRTGLRRGGVTVGEGVLDPFLDRARTAYETWAGLAQEPAAGAAQGSLVRFPHARPLAAVSVLADPGTRGDVEVHVPGQGWCRLGPLADRGATELTVGQPPSPDPVTHPPALVPRTPPPADPVTHPPALVPSPAAVAGTQADAVRVTGADSGRVRHLVPWFADSPAVRMDLPGAVADAEIGGTERLSVRLTAQRPADVRGRLTVRAPQGVHVRVPAVAPTVPRGTAVTVPVEVTVPAHTPSRPYEVRLSFGGTTRTLTLRAFPRTAGPDAARTGTASSSGDETADFPASAANDGDTTGTRWSSPADDGAWWQVELARPVRLGQVVLHWQDAYAAAYRVQVSPDGRRWRTAASVRDGHGGRESLRMDEKDVRYVRIQGERRATPYGYSLWSVEAYAVAD